MASSDVMLKCNGWDEMFDGTRQLEDADMAFRLGACKYSVALDGDPVVIEYIQKKWNTDERIMAKNPFLKCNGAYFYPIIFSGKKRYMANIGIPTRDEIMSFTFNHCRMVKDGSCTVSKDDCTGTENWKWRCDPPPGCANWNDSININEHFEYMNMVYRDKRIIFDLRNIRRDVASGKITMSSILQ